MAHRPDIIHYTLRRATALDVTFLFQVSIEAMRPVVDMLHPNRPLLTDKKFKEYQKKFVPDEIEVIQFENADVGRLRVVRSSECLYIGGLQILPEFQQRGIGTAVMTDLIKESERANVPIVLEVHEVNSNARNFYQGLGFIEVEQKEGKLGMRYGSH